MRNTIDFELRLATDAQIIHINNLLAELHQKQSLLVHVPKLMNMKQARTTITFLKQKLAEVQP